MPETSPAITADSQAARIFAWRRGFNTMYLIHLGIELGLLENLRQAPGTSAEHLAARLKLHAPYVDVWCKTAYGMEVLEYDARAGYSLAPYMDQILASPGHPRYLGGYVQLGVGVAADDFLRLVGAFRSGDAIPFQGRGDAFNYAIAGATWGLQIATAKKFLPGLNGMSERLAAGGSVLEVGCGTGNLLVQLAKAFPAARIIGVDIDAESLQAATRRATEAGVMERISIRSGAVASATAPASVDAVVMVEVLHEIGQAIRPQVIRECAAALKPGGWLLIVDETYPETPEQMRKPEFLFPLHTGFEELLWGNIIPTRQEQESLLAGAGLTGAVERTIIGEGFTVLATQKP